MYLGRSVMKSPYFLGSFTRCTQIDAKPPQRFAATARQCFFRAITVSLHQGSNSVTPIMRGGITKFLSGAAATETDRRLRCPRASNRLSYLASSHSSRHVARQKKKLLSKISRQSRNSASSDIFAGRANRTVPQNLTTLTPGVLSC